MSRKWSFEGNVSMETKLLCVSIRLLWPVYFNLKNFITQSCQLNFVFDCATKTPDCIGGSKKALAIIKKITPSVIIKTQSGNCKKTEGGHKMHDNNSLAHTSWNCKYHIVFAPKIFYGEHRAEIGKILRELCDWKGVHIIEAEVCPDQIHELAEIPPKMSVSSFVGFLKGKSSVMIHQRHGNLKYKYGNRSFWCRGYYVDTAGKNAKN